MRTSMTDMIGCEYPIFAFSHCRDVVAAVTNAGGFGIFGATGRSAGDVDVDLAWLDANTRGKYGIDLLLPQKLGIPGSIGPLPPPPAEQLEFVEALMTRYGVPPLPEDDAHQLRLSQRANEMMSDAVEIWDIAGEHNVSMYVSALGAPPPDLIEQAHSRGGVVGGLVGAAPHAKRQLQAGVDFVVAQGTEAGGHCGEIATMVLVPDIVDVMGDIPVLAAGGIATGRQMAAALALGAAGVWTGSVWLTTHEAETDPVVKEKFLRATASDTVRSRSSTGKPARQLRSAWTSEWEDPANPDPLGMPMHGALIREAKARIRRGSHVPGSGSEALANYFVGQVVGRLNTVKSSRQVVEEMVGEYIDVMARLESINA
ncbi:MAG: conserved hypothetical dioxygenase [Jatrophihabitantaceae bacterium]|nr:conserved hypothetical dioxygenase [Jatrophihabitantaceae bacterium]